MSPTRSNPSGRLRHQTWPAALAIVIIALAAAAGCARTSSSGAAHADATKARQVIASASANPTVQADYQAEKAKVVAALPAGAGVTISGTIAAYHQLATKAGRQVFYQKVGLNATQKSQLEAWFFTAPPAGKSPLHLMFTHTGRMQVLNVLLPAELHKIGV